MEFLLTYQKDGELKYTWFETAEELFEFAETVDVVEDAIEVRVVRQLI